MEMREAGPAQWTAVLGAAGRDISRTAQPWRAPGWAGLLSAAGAIVDVRSPGEFARGAIPGACNHPLLSDAERAEIGLLYRHAGRERTLAQGLARLSPRLEDYLGGFARWRECGVLIYCARGGLRSRAVAEALCRRGVTALALPGGYKAFRNHVLELLAQTPPQHWLVLQGRTGAGKTWLLERLPNALNLEALAQHRSSLFGGLGQSPRSQQAFEAELCLALGQLEARRPAWIEAESRKIGPVFMPQALHQALRQGCCVLVSASLETRVHRLVEAYAPRNDAEAARLQEVLAGLSSRLGHTAVQELCAWVGQGRFAQVAEVLLVRHYDPRYDHAIRRWQVQAQLSSEDLPAALAALGEFAHACRLHSG